MDILNKILLTVLVMSSLNVIRHLYYFTQAWVKSDTETPQKYKLGNGSLWVLSMSISYIITSLICGVFI